MRNLLFIFLFIQLSIPCLYSQLPWSQLDSFIVKRHNQANNQVVEIEVPGVLPLLFRMPVATISPTAVLLDDVPAYSWSFGCANTVGAMAAGYYDNHGYPGLYTGISNEGLMPLDNILWGTVNINGEIRNQCPLSATMMGLDERQSYGHVDDFWYQYHHYGPDPYISLNRNRHTDEDCTGDFMGSNQSAFNNADGNTRFFFLPDGAPLYDYTGNEPNQRDGCHGLRLFYESKECMLIENFTQLVAGMYGNVTGFTFNQFMEEIDNGRPVLIQLAGHCVLGFGYDQTGQYIYLHDTWDYSVHSMVWGQNYAGMLHWGVTVLRLAADYEPPLADFTASSLSICAGEMVQFQDYSLYSPESWDWTFEGAQNQTSGEQHPNVIYPEPGVFSVSLTVTNAYGYDSKIIHSLINVGEPCYCLVNGNGEVFIEEMRFGNIISLTNYSQGGYSMIENLSTMVYAGLRYPILVRVSSETPGISKCGVWLDWNRDMYFEENELIVLDRAGAGLYTGIVLVPLNSVTGGSRIRVQVNNDSFFYACGVCSGETEDYPFIIADVQLSKQLMVRVFPEGLFQHGPGLLSKAKTELGNVFPDDIVDVVSIELTEAYAPFTQVFSSHNLALNNQGLVLMRLPSSFNSAYYLIIRHRNSVAIWSATAIVMEGNNLYVDFTTSITSAYGQNLLSDGVHALIYSGDINQDGYVDVNDILNVESCASAFQKGYLTEDINGDGLIDAEDLIIVDNNSARHIVVLGPD